MTWPLVSGCAVLCALYFVLCGLFARGASFNGNTKSKYKAPVQSSKTQGPKTFLKPLIGLPGESAPNIQTMLAVRLAVSLVEIAIELR